MADGKKYTERPSHLVISAEGPEAEKTVDENTANQDQKIGAKGSFPGNESDESGPTAAEAKGSEVAKALAILMKHVPELRKMAGTEAAAAGTEAPAEVGASFSGEAAPLGKAQERFLKNLDGYLTKFETHIINEVRKEMAKNTEQLKKSMGLVPTGSETPHAPSPKESSPAATPGSALKKNDGERKRVTFDDLAAGPKMKGML